MVVVFYPVLPLLHQMDPHNLSQYLQTSVSLNCDKVTDPSTVMLLPLIWKQWCNTGQMTYFIFGNQYCCLKDAMNNCGPTCRSLRQSSITIQPPMFIHYDKFCKWCVRSNISWVWYHMEDLNAVIFHQLEYSLSRNVWRGCNWLFEETWPFLWRSWISWV